MTAEQGFRIFLFENPLEGDYIKTTAAINGLAITFNNALNIIDAEFTLNDSEVLADPLHRIKIGATGQDTANNLKLFLENNGYSSSDIPFIYSIVTTGGTIYGVEASVIANNVVDFSLDSGPGSRAVLNSYYNMPVVTTGLKYFFEYENVAGITWRCEIYQKDYTGTSLEINGRANIIRGSATDLVTPIRGTGLDLTLQANKDLTFQDLYTENESDFSVKLYRGNVIYFQGFVKPDGFFQSYADVAWDVSVQCVDGLGFLSDLAFVASNGLPFFGKRSMLDIIYNCLSRTGLLLKIKTFVPVYYYGLAVNPNTDVLKESYINVEKFKNADDGEPMNCAEVLSSILQIFNAVVTQQGGEWYIYRPADIYSESYPVFKTYNIANQFIGLYQLNTNRTIGSDINNFGSIHCNRNQKIEIKGALSAFRIAYKYGIEDSLLPNPQLGHTAGTSTYEDWTVSSWTQSRKNGYLVVDPVSKNGISFISGVTFIGETYAPIVAITSNSNPTIQKDTLVQFKTRILSYGYPAVVRYEVQVGSYWLNWTNGSWQNSPLTFDVASAPPGAYPNSTGEIVDQNFERTYSIDSEPVPAEGILIIRAYVPVKPSNNLPGVKVDIKSVEVLNSSTGDNIVGEFHTVKRLSKVSTIVKDNKTVILGDNRNFVYLGAIYKNDQVSFTETWYRQFFAGSEVKPILRISAEDSMRLSQKPNMLFTGDVYGFIDYITRIKIDNIDAAFMPISWGHNTFTNITQLSSLELYAPEMQDLDYAKTNDYGETIKPTIV